MRCSYCGSDEVKQIAPDQIRCQFCQKITRLNASPLVTHAKVQSQNEPKAQALDFEDLFTRVMRLKGEAGDGSGFIIGPKGHVITNAHVIKDSPILEGIRGNFPALLELEPISDGTVMNLDLALLSFVDDHDFPAFNWAKSLPTVGEEVFILGNPKNLGLSVTRATVSQIKTHELQLNATLNPGNSGGPVVNHKGEVVGVVSYLIEDVQGMAFAIHLEAIQTFIQATFQGRKDPHV